MDGKLIKGSFGSICLFVVYFVLLLSKKQRKSPPFFKKKYACSFEIIFQPFNNIFFSQ